MRKAIATVFIVVLFGCLAYRATGERYTGAAKHPVDVPVIGALLAELEFVGPASYRGFEHPHGGGTFVLIGIATPTSVSQFCDKSSVSFSFEGDELQPRADILRYFQQNDISLSEAMPVDTAKVMFGMGVRFRKLYGVYQPATQKFVISLHLDETK